MLRLPQLVLFLDLIHVGITSQHIEAVFVVTFDISKFLSRLRIGFDPCIGVVAEDPRLPFTAAEVFIIAMSSAAIYLLQWVRVSAVGGVAVGL